MALINKKKVETDIFVYTFLKNGKNWKKLKKFIKDGAFLNYMNQFK